MTQKHSPPVEVGPLIVGVDVGGTKIAAGLVDANGHIYGRVKLPTDTSQPEMTLRSIAAAISATLDATGVEPAQLAGIGLGIPGKIDPEQGIAQLAVNLGWHNVPVKHWLEEQLGISCSIENDVSAACLGEGLYGAGRGMANMLYLSLGTGIAARVLIEGRLYRGTNGMAGELGHAIFVPNGPGCNCGADGCLEALASGPALVRLAREKLATGQTSLLRDLPDYQSALTAEQICEAATHGDDLAWQILNEAAAHLGYAIHLLAMAFDPQCIILGGGMAQEGPLIDAIRSAVARLAEQAPIFREIFPLEALLLSSLRLDAGILGAASLVHTRLKVSGREI
jgi:glucokinase